MISAASSFPMIGLHNVKQDLTLIQLSALIVYKCITWVSALVSGIFSCILSKMY